MGTFLLSVSPADADPVNFQREVRPILSDNCFQCHGPDLKTRLAGLRLDSREEVFAQRSSGSLIVAGDPDASLLYQRVSSEDPGRRMPPVHSKKELTQEQIDTLRLWIEQGATWDEHWSFQRPRRPLLPAVANRFWERNPIDRFILARLESAGLAPNPEADRRTLARRLALDLTGLPPTVEQVESFVSDGSEKSYESLVDRLLGSPHWGEHRARYWLDAGRYADTHGMHVDNYREMWPYRDWVIQAFNRNLPFDRFTIEQLAGDLLPSPTLDQLIATGFHRNNVTTNEGGAITEEVQAIYDKDRVDTTGTVWLGLTVACATCHDHKFDPISTKDYYSMVAFFRNGTQHAMDGNVADTPPVVVVPAAEDQDHWEKVRRRIRDVRSRQRRMAASQDERFDSWLVSEAYQSQELYLDASWEVLALSVEGGLQASLGLEPLDLDVPEGITLGAGPWEGEGPQALHFAERSWLELPDLDQMNGGHPFSITTWIVQPKNDGSVVVASQLDPAEEGVGWSLDLFGRKPKLTMVGQDESSISIRPSQSHQLRVGTWNHLAITYDGTREGAGLNFYLNGERVPVEGSEFFDRLEGDISGRPILIGRKVALEEESSFAGGAMADFRIFNRALTFEEARLVSLYPTLERAREKERSRLLKEDREALRLAYLVHQPEYRSLVDELRELESKRREVRRRGAITHVFQERSDGQPFAHILYRGQYDQPRERVRADTPDALPPMPASFPRNRLGLARWLVSESNPLTARVVVNRFWQEVFGTGLVPTVDDFGSQGEPPSHPELLDWLAVEFRDARWDVKGLFRLMVTSSAYRQSATANPEKLGKDPQNRLLSRGPRFRMDAEGLRDSALAASGLLVDRIGGPSVRPYQPVNVWETVAMRISNTREYEQDRGDRLYRRSLYTFWKRAAPPSSMEIFNAPTREYCTVRRERTNTPLQALVTMNDPQFVEAARQLAQRAIRKVGGDFDGQLDYLTLRLLARRFQPEEREAAHRAYRNLLHEYQNDAEAARKLLATGESEPDSSLPEAESAALAMAANLVMNLDEALNK